jgi:hypothetical protein
MIAQTTRRGQGGTTQRSVDFRRRSPAFGFAQGRLSRKGSEKWGVPTLSERCRLAEVQASFDYCAGALAKVDDSKLGEEVPLFKRTRANVMMLLVADLAGHYSLAAVYLRLNGIVPPTAQPKK